MTKEPRIHNGERIAFSINGIGKPDSHMQKNETEPLSSSIHKINSKWMKDMNVRPETIKLLEENITGKLIDFSLGNDYSDLKIKAKTN